MTKKDNHLPTLIVSMEEALSKLQERIEQGKSLLNEKCLSMQDIDDAKKRYYSWSEYNSALIQKLFEGDKFYNEYSRSHGIYSSGLGPPSPKEVYEDFVDMVSAKLRKLESIVDRIELLDVKNNIQSHTRNQAASINQDNKRVFIVHGHDDGMKETVARFVEKIELDAIILHEKADRSMTIIEKLEKYSDVGFAIILLSPDDEGNELGATSLNPRARQNVVFEFGLFFGLLGRGNVVALLKDNVEKPSDISGILYKPFDGNGGWKSELMKELHAAGMKFNNKKLYS